MAETPISDTPINCPKCGYTQTIGELRASHRCGNCGHSTRSAAQLRELERKAELDDVRSRLRLLESEREAHLSIFRWLLGEEGEFPESLPGRRYNFRSELHQRLAAAARLDTPT